jgi:HTH-type transcriptional regulator, competence development regulator
MPSAKTLGDTLREARIALDMSLRELARKADIAPSYLSDIENDRRVPAEDLLQTLATLLKLPFDDLMAMAGRVGDDAERYLKKHPSAGVLFRRLAEKGVGEERLKELLEQVERGPKKTR